jgi:uncharacterized protein DUF6286
MILLRALLRLVTFVLLVVLAVAGLAAAVFSIQGGTGGLSLPKLAEYAQLPAVRDRTGDLLSAVEASGGVARYSLLAGALAVLLGLLLLVAALVPRRERLVELERGDDGTLNARRRPLAQAARALVEPARGVTEAKVRARARRRGGGTLRVRALRTRPAQDAAIRASIAERLQPLTQPFKLKTTVRVREADRGARVQ